MMKEKKSEHEWKYSINNKIIEYHPTKGKELAVQVPNHITTTYHAPMNYTHWYYYIHYFYCKGSFYFTVQLHIIKCIWGKECVCVPMLYSFNLHRIKNTKEGHK